MQQYAYGSSPAGPERDQLRQDLLRYCNTDTEIMVDSWRALTHSPNKGVFHGPSHASN